ncbi:MAG TPA: sulfite exporter TauE/SafE family protein [Tabrizicola sp.]|nr:sulfite exporter TauE/SafE family protein [Tabrizicola sp.]
MAEILGTPDVWPRLALLLLITLAASLARGFSGFGAALIFVPLASALLGPRVAAPLLLITDSLMSLPMIPRALPLANRREAATMAIGAIVGVPAGPGWRPAPPPHPARGARAPLAGSVLVLWAAGWRYRGQPKPPLTVLVGFVSGTCSGAAQIGGPPVVAYWLGGVNRAPAVRANIVVFFALTSLLSIAGYLWGGLFSLQILTLAALIAPVYGAGLWAGSHMFGLASERTFRRICLAMIALATVVSLPVLDGWLRGG